MIVAILTKDLQFQLQTFAIGVKETDFNELPYAELVAKDCRTQHYEECVAPDLIHLLPKMIWHLDEPSDPIAACMFHSAQLASKYVKVVLGGDGGDELFAGFDRYKGNDYIQAYRLIPEIMRTKLLGPLLDLAPDSFTYKSLNQKMRWVHQLSMMPNPGREYAEATCFFRFSHSDKEKLYNPSYWQRMSGIDAADVIVDNYNHNQASETVDRMLFADIMTRLPEHSLMLTDRMTMAHGLEARSPFLDHELVEYLATFPSNLKIKDGETKFILRKLAENYLPKSIVEEKNKDSVYQSLIGSEMNCIPFFKCLLILIMLNKVYFKRITFKLY
jgi:asparagine synthase (glutamine-hydrolysing)